MISNNNSNLASTLGAFTPTEHALIMGTLLGDGTSVKRGNSYRIRLCHSVYSQKEYVLWKYGKLKRLCPTTQPPVATKNGSFEFYLTSGPHLKKYDDLYYHMVEVTDPKTGVTKVSRTKMITPGLIKELPKNPLLLATWFMDDGSVRSDCYAGRLATHSFSFDQLEMLQAYLRNTWDLAFEIKIHTKVSKQHILTIPATGNVFGDFAEIIKPVLQEVPTMEYKLNEIRKALSLENRDLL